jgi:hypothetical protein
MRRHVQTSWALRPCLSALGPHQEQGPTKRRQGVLTSEVSISTAFARDRRKTFLCLHETSYCLWKRVM